MAELIGTGQVDNLKNVNIAVIGTGLIGSRLAKSFKVTPLSHKRGDIDVANIDSISTALVSYPKGSIVVDCSGIAAVDPIESQQVLGEGGPAYRVNVTGTQNLTEYCQDRKHFLVHFSSETVFGRGKKDRVILERDRPSREMPASERSYYATLKALAEHLMYTYFENGKGLQIRIEYPSDINAGYLIKALEFKSLVTDCVITPTLIAELGPIVAQAYLRGISGVTLHTVGSPTTPHKLVSDAWHQMGLHVDIPQSRYADLKSAAVRPQYSHLSKISTQDWLDKRLRATDQQLSYLLANY